MTDEQTRLALAERTTGNVGVGNSDREQLEAFALMRARSRIEALEAENERLRESLHWYVYECDWSFMRTGSEAHINLWSYDKGSRARQALGAQHKAA